MTTFANITGADQLIEELTLPLAEIELNIQELKTRKTELETSLRAGGKNFNLEALKGNKGNQDEPDLVDRALEGAYEEHDRIVKSNSDHAYKKSIEIIQEYSNSFRNNKKTENAQIIQKIHEIREIFKAMEQEDIEITSQLRKFAGEVEKFVSDEPISKGGHNSKRFLLGMSLYHNAPSNRLKFFDVFNEQDYGISGLIKQKYDTTLSERQSDLKYGVTSN